MINITEDIKMLQVLFFINDDMYEDDDFKNVHLIDMKYIFMKIITMTIIQWML